MGDALRRGLDALRALERGPVEKTDVWSQLDLMVAKTRGDGPQVDMLRPEPVRSVDDYLAAEDGGTLRAHGPAPRPEAEADCEGAAAGAGDDAP
jgi:hypothetical protein